MSEANLIRVSDGQERTSQGSAVGPRHVFISHSHEDGFTEARLLADWLEENGFTTWLDDRIVGGNTYDAMIEEAIRDSSVVVVIVTTDTERPNSFVRKEIEYAQGCNKPIVPVRCADVQGPIQLKTHHWLSESDAMGPKMLACLQHATEVGTPSNKRLRARRWRRPLVPKGVLLVVVAGIVAAIAIGLPLITSRNQLRIAYAAHIELLEVRAKAIASEIHDSATRAKFESLHNENIGALRAGKVTLSHEITRQIHLLLEQDLPQAHTTYLPPIDDDSKTTEDFVANVASRQSIPERYPLFERRGDMTKTAGGGRVPGSVDEPADGSSQEIPSDIQPTGIPRLDPADLRRPLGHEDTPSAGQPFADASNAVGSARADNPNIDSQDAGNQQLSDARPQGKSMTADELIEVLGKRALEIEDDINQSLAGDPRVEEIRNRFLSLHTQNVAALRQGDLALHRDLSAEIHRLLHSVYHVVYRPIISEDGKVTLPNPMMGRYPTWDRINGESTTSTRKSSIDHTV